MEEFKIKNPKSLSIIVGSVIILIGIILTVLALLGIPDYGGCPCASSFTFRLGSALAEIVNNLIPCYGICPLGFCNALPGECGTVEVVIPFDLFLLGGIILFVGIKKGK